MDNKGYNVDDILSEIKTRKIREKSDKSTSPKTKAKPPLSFGDDDMHTDFASQTPPIKQYNPPQAKPQTPKKPQPMQTAPQKSAVQESVRQSAVTSQAPSVPAGQAPIAQKRPSRSKPVQMEDPKAPYAQQDFDGQKPQMPKRKPGIAEQMAQKALREQGELAKNAEAKGKNPLDFDSHVRPINERAKIRQMTGTRQLPKFDFSKDAFEDDTDPVDMGHTRVMPKASDLIDIDTGKLSKTAPVKEKRKPDPVAFFDDYGDDSGAQESSSIDYSEYNSTSDRRDVQTDIAKIKLWLFIRVSATFILTIVLFMFTFWGRYANVPLLPGALEPVPESMRAYLIACTVLTIIIAVINSSSVGGGLIGLFKLHANSDTIVSFAILAAVGQGVAGVASPESIDPISLSLYFSAAALAMLFNGIGKTTMINRIQQNFKIISSDSDKKAMLQVDSDEFCREFFKNDTTRPVIAYAVKAGFFTDFLGLSYSDKYDVGVNRMVAPVCLGGSLIVSVSTYFLTKDMFSAVSALTAVLCISATLSSTFIENVPLSKLTKKLVSQGASVSGTKAVEDFCETQAIVLTENDLFPKGNVKLHGIKAFSQGRIDEAIVDAASVLCAMNGALGPVFLEMIGGNKKLLKKVDNIVYENEMGISAWVDSRRVLIGNRRLMLNHGIILPPEVLNQPITAIDNEVLYLSNSGEASAQFSVSYHIDEDLALELDNMGARDKILIVQTTDANVTAEKIWELYGYPLDLIRILPAESLPLYQKITQPRDKASAEIVFDGSPRVLVKVLLSCITAKSSILTATVVQMAQIIIGYAMVVYFAFMGTIGTFSIIQVCVFQIFWFITIFIIQKVRQS